eukprot:GHVQ01004471.1.p1 GENE.GHVQ01004471.1~~GHVQ01004471.1.p1  ORF type:complete len:472 (+),score=75.16 GHVQ01004471.1:508-1923(+)
MDIAAPVGFSLARKPQVDIPGNPVQLSDKSSPRIGFPGALPSSLPTHRRSIESLSTRRMSDKNKERGILDQGLLLGIGGGLEDGSGNLKSNSSTATNNKAKMSRVESDVIKSSSVSEEADGEKTGTDRQSLCCDLLMKGNVQSFIDLFYVTSSSDLPDPALVFVKETLQTAENSRRVENFSAGFEDYSILAEYFERQDDYSRGRYFYERCRDIAKDAGINESLAKALLHLGLCEEKEERWHQARLQHERSLETATILDSLPFQIRAATRLVEVYAKLAETVETNYEQVCRYLERRLACARLTKNSSLEGCACYDLGRALHKLGRYEEEIVLQKEYLGLCRAREDFVGESSARAALAEAYQKSGESKEAIGQLEQLLSSDGKELKAQVQACLSLGLLYSEAKEPEKSADLLEQHFELSRQLGERNVLDAARVILGVARGTDQMATFQEAVNTQNIYKLLKWKTDRRPLIEDS